MSELGLLRKPECNFRLGFILPINGLLWRIQAQIVSFMEGNSASIVGEGFFHSRIYNFTSKKRDGKTKKKYAEIEETSYNSIKKF